MIRLTLAIGTVVFYAIRWRPSVLKRVAKRNLNIALSTIDLLFLLLVTYQLTDMRQLQFQAPSYIHYIGLVVATLGAAFASFARLALKHNYLPASSTAPPSSMTTGGPYRVVRHPAYLGTIMAFIGFEMALANFLIFIALPFVFFVCKQIAKEESILSSFHGGEWQQFTTKTPYKLIPYIY